MVNNYEIRYIVYSKRRIQDIRMFRTSGNSYGDAIRNFLLWANSKEEKLDQKGKPLKFDMNPVTEASILSIACVSY